MADINTRIIISARDMATSQFRSVGAEVSKTKREMSGLDMTMASLGKATAYLGGAAGLAGLVMSAGRAVTQIDRLEKSFKGISGGSASAAADEMAFVRQVSGDLGTNLFSTAEAYKLVTAASQGTTLQGAAAREIFLGVSEASAVLGLTNEQTSGSLLAISQMIGKGTVQAEEFRGQLGERLPVALRLAAKAMNMTTQEFNQALEKGEILAEDLLPKLARALRDEYSEAAKEAAETDLGRAWERAKNSATEFAVAINKASGASQVAATSVNTLAEGMGGLARIVTAMELVQQGRLGFGEWATMSREDARAFVEQAEAVESLATQIERLEKKKAGMLYREERQEVQALIDELTALREAKLKAGYVASAAGVKDTWLARNTGMESANLRAAEELDKRKPEPLPDISARDLTTPSAASARSVVTAQDELAGWMALQDMRREKTQQNLELERDFYADLAELTGDNEAAQMAAIQREYEVYAKVIGDEAALARWLAEEQLRASRDASAGAILALREIADEASNWADQVGGAIRSFSDDFTEVMVNGIVDGKWAWTDLADHAIRQLMRIAVQQVIIGAVASAAGNALSSYFGGGGTTSPKPPVSNALGGIYSSPSLSSYSGKVVNKPTMFAFAHGTGIMGEAGPEAIMPLKRGSDGKLGVAAQGGGAPVVNVVIENHSGEPVQQKQSTNSDGVKELRVIVGQIIADQIHNGGPARQALESRYSMRPRQ